MHHRGQDIASNPSNPPGLLTFCEHKQIYGARKHGCFIVAMDTAFYNDISWILLNISRKIELNYNSPRCSFHTNQMISLRQTRQNPQC